MREKSPSVFINCPYDRDYLRSFWAVIFAIYDNGFEPRSALEVNAASARLTRIQDIIRQCKLSIHDLCRADDPRFNMPFEAGLAFGLQISSRNAHHPLLLTNDREKFDRACSDLRGLDPTIYANDHDLVAGITEWLHGFFDHRYYLPDAEQTADRFEKFWQTAALNERIGAGRRPPTWSEMLGAAYSFIQANKPDRPRGRLKRPL